MGTTRTPRPTRIPPIETEAFTPVDPVTGAPPTGEAPSVATHSSPLPEPVDPGDERLRSALHGAPRPDETSEAYRRGLDRMAQRPRQRDDERNAPDGSRYGEWNVPAPVDRADDRIYNISPPDSGDDPYGVPIPNDIGLADAARAFDTDWAERNQLIHDSPITLFLKAHERAGSPNELTITGVADVRVKLGDLREYARLLDP